jgi:molybdopterin converting factor subunit 1
MKNTVRYFALLRERAGAEAEVVEWEDPAPDIGKLRELLAARTPGIAPWLRAPSLLVAVNREYAAADTPLKDGDEVAFLPPVSGG